MPYTHLLFQKTKCIAITAKGRIRVLDSSSGRSLCSTDGRADVKLGPVIAADVCGDETEYLVTVTEDKVLRVWKTDDLSILSERTTVKKPTSLRITMDASTILISDKFGDVYSFSLIPPDATSNTNPEGSEATLKRTNPNSLDSLGGKLLMGHVSLLTTFLLSPDENFIITADRDEHIRVSWFPESYVIESYCLGQKKFVSALHIPGWDSSRLLSGGGDPEIKLWNWMEGTLISKFDVADVVLPFVKVIRRRSSGWDGSGDDGEGEGGGEKQLTKAQKRKQRKKGKGKVDASEPVVLQEEIEADAEVDNTMDVDDISSPARAGSAAAGDEKEDSEEPVLAISKIDSLETSSHKFCFFSAIGSTALFYFELPDALEPSSNAEVSIKHYDLGKPVLNFYVLREAGEIWALTDRECATVSVLRLEGSDFDEIPRSCVFPKLRCPLRSSDIPNSTTTTVDLYAQLASLPKHTGHDREPYTSAGGRDTDTPDAQEISKKEQGRMKARRAREAIALKRASEAGDGSNIPTEERDAKKTKGDP